MENVKDLDKRKGFVKVSKIFFKKEVDVETLQVFFSNFFPVVCSHEGDTITYLGISHFFKNVEEENSIPTYDFIFERSANNIVSIKEVKLLS